MGRFSKAFGLEDAFYPDRRNFIKNAGIAAFGAAIGATTLSELLMPKKAYASVDELTDAEISRYMGMSKVEDILGNSVKYITPQTWDKEINASDKPVLVLVYDNMNGGYNSTSKRSAIIFTKLVQIYKNQINFIACYGDQFLLRYNIRSSPSISMYSKYDLLKGESPEINNGRTKLIDIFRGGPSSDELIQKEWLPFTQKWVQTNLTNPNYQWAWRMNNSWNEQKVFYKR